MSKYHPAKRFLTNKEVEMIFFQKPLSFRILNFYAAIDKQNREILETDPESGTPFNPHIINQSPVTWIQSTTNEGEKSRHFCAPEEEIDEHRAILRCTL